MFAFCIYNSPTRSLFLARDQFGIKPLFYTFQRDGFAFASELKTLSCLPGLRKEVCGKALVSCVNYSWVSGCETMFSGIYKLPAATYMEIDSNVKSASRPFWEVPTSCKTESFPELVHQLQGKLEGSIQRHMVADVPVGAFLSGGLDSSLICVLAQGAGSRLSTFTIATDQADKNIEQMPDDERFASALARSQGFDHHELRISPRIVELLPAMVRTLDEPLGDPAAINTFLICQEARKQGIKVLLSGMGADEIFFGYRRHLATLLTGYYRELPFFSRNFLEWGGPLLPVRLGKYGLWPFRWAKRFLHFASLPLSQAYMRSFSYYDRRDLGMLLLPHLRPCIDQVDDEFTQIFSSKFSEDPVNQICHTDLHLFMQGLNLTYTDRASMAASVEVRVPFIDKEVISFAMGLPGTFKFKKLQGKYILKKAAEKYLPRDIIYRPKASFGAPIRAWISGDLKPLVEELLSQRSVENRGIFCYSEVKKLIEDDRRGWQDNAYQIYQLLSIELWFREFMDGKGLS